MKTTYRSLFFSTLAFSLITSSVFANCRSEYVKLHDGPYEKVFERTVYTGAGLGAGGNVASLIMGVEETMSMVPATFAVVAGVGGTTTAYIKIKQHQLKVITNLLDQAELGAGVELTDFTRKLSKTLGKELPVSTVAATLNQADTQGVFCTNGKLYSGREIQSYMLETLKNY